MKLHADAVSLHAGAKLLVEASVTAPPGTFAGLIGPNGSGKSSLLRLLAGLSVPTSGTVTLDGSAYRGRALAQRLAYVGQHTATDTDMTVRDVLLLGRIPHRPLLSPVNRADHDRAEAACLRAGLPGYLDRDWTSLSGGEQQRVNIARALLQEPRVLLLDEPTNHLDIRHQLDLLESLAATDTTVIAALHDLTLAARYCDFLVLLAAGRVVATGTPAEVLTPVRIAEVFDVDADLTHDDEGHLLLHLRPHRGR